MPADPPFRFDAYRLEVRNEQLWCGAQAIRLTAKAIRVLRYLVEHAGQLVSKEALFEAVWPETVVSEGVLTNCIGELRKALGDAAQAPRFIATDATTTAVISSPILSMRWSSADGTVTTIAQGAKRSS